MFNRIRWQRGDLLRQPDFMNVWTAETISQFGAQISIFAVPIIAAVTLDASPLEMGILAAAGRVPQLLLGFIAGAWVDRLPRLPIMLVTNIGRMVASSMIPLAALSGNLTFAVLLAVAVISGAQSVFFNAAWGAMLPGLVGRAHLTDATSKLMGSASLAQVVGPALGGIIVGFIGGPHAMWIPVVTFAASAWFLFRVEAREMVPDRSTSATTMWMEVREGLVELWREPVVRALMNSAIVLQFGGGVFNAVYILFMTNELGLSSQGIGLVFASGGLAALAGAAFAPRIASSLGVGPSILWSGIAFGLGNLPVPLAFYFQDIALPAIVLSEALAWSSLMVFNVNRFALRQIVTPDHLRGRIGASSGTLISTAIMAGSLVGGVIGQAVGVHEALYVSIAVMGMAAIWVWRSPVPGVMEFPPERVEPAKNAAV